PIVLYQHWIGGHPHEIRSRMFSYFAWIGIPGALIAAASGVFTVEVWRFGGIALPAMVAGIFLSRAVRDLVSPAWFNRSSMLLLVVSSSAAIVGALLALR